ncbi:MAG: cupin domain-containing protein [Actinomycetota bacterium]|nr:cupin domain-containing protein [Actinomycetota bacterium]
MPGEMTADDVRELLGLQAHATCGFVAETYRSVERIAPGGLEAPFDAGRPLGSALYFLVTPDAPVRLHRIRNHQLYHRYLGDPIEVVLLYPDGTTGHEIVGPDLRHGHKLQLLIPGSTFHTARLMPGGSWFLGASTEWPGVETPDVELGDVDQLSALYPAAAQALRSFAG